MLCMWVSLDPRIWLPCPVSLQLVFNSAICGVATRHLSLTPPSTMSYNSSLLSLTDHWSLITIWYGSGSPNSKVNKTALATAANEGPHPNGWPAMPPGHSQVYGDRWDPPRRAEGTGRGAGQDTLYHLWAVLAKRGGPTWREDCQCNTHLQEGLEGESWELQSCQPYLGVGQDYGVIHPECAHQACEGQWRVQAQPVWVHER